MDTVNAIVGLTPALSPTRPRPAATPTTDYANMFIIAGPMVALYIIGIGVAFVFGGRARHRGQPGGA